MGNRSGQIFVSSWEIPGNSLRFGLLIPTLLCLSGCSRGDDPGWKGSAPLPDGLESREAASDPHPWRRTLHATLQALGFPENSAALRTLEAEEVLAEAASSRIERTSIEATPPSEGVQATLTVTNTADSGAGSLRQAILDANITLAQDLITFNIAGAGPHLITPQTPLPAITQRAVLDGCTQPGSICTAWPPTLQIELDFSSSGRGLFIAAGNSTVRGLSLVGSTYTQTLAPAEALGLYSRGGNRIQTNYFGVRSDGVTTLANSYAVVISDLSGSNIVGSDGDGSNDDNERNLMSGNFGGIYIENSGGSNTLSGNYIGVTPNASACLQNALPGIWINGDTGNNLILENVVGCNTAAGLYLEFVNGDTLTGNVVGTDPTGTLALGNFGPGIWLENTTRTLIGGSFEDANLIANNPGPGILLDSGLGTGNRVSLNQIRDNGALGIDLYPSAGANRNDAGDEDTGTNDLQNFPEVGPFQLSGDRISIPYRVLSAPQYAVYPLTVEFFLADSTGEEGMTWLGTSSYLEADAQRTAIAAFVPTISIPLGARIVATATDRNGNTSEFTSKDADADGYTYTTDCNDADPSIHPGATDAPGDGIDQNCDGLEVCHLDMDDDGYRPGAGETIASSDTDCDDSGEARATDPVGDCDDSAASTHPGAIEQCDGTDSDCDGSLVDDFPDNDADGQPDCTDPDDDNDGLSDLNDNCPLVKNSDQLDTDQNGIGDACEQDQDGDNYADALDNCPTVRNSDQADMDLDGKGDACDSDADGDGASNAADCNDRDAAVAVPHTYCGDLDGDGFGNVSDPFEVCSAVPPNGYVPDCSDNCPNVSNTDQADLDHDGLGNPCDTDADGDDVSAGQDCNDLDPSVEAVRTWYKDSDGDGLGDSSVSLDVCSVSPPPGYAAVGNDNCPSTYNPDQVDLDKDGVGDSCDTDKDGDGADTSTDCDDYNSSVTAFHTWYYDLDRDGYGDPSEPLQQCAQNPPSGYVADGTDNCPLISNPDQANLDGDALGDVCDDDVDGDGVDASTDCDDGNASTLGPTTFYFDGDLDGYGVPETTLELCALSPPTGYSSNPDDNCPAVANPDQLDQDGDGLGAACDPNDLPPTPTPGPTPTSTPTPTPTPAPTPEEPTSTPTPPPAATLTPSLTPSPSPGSTPTSTPDTATPTPFLEQGEVQGSGCQCSPADDSGDTPAAALMVFVFGLWWNGRRRRQV